MFRLVFQFSREYFLSLSRSRCHEESRFVHHRNGDDVAEEDDDDGDDGGGSSSLPVAA